MQDCVTPVEFLCESMLGFPLLLEAFMAVVVKPFAL